jgi:hypothetical protein
MCGDDGFGHAEITKSLFGCDEQFAVKYHENKGHLIDTIETSLGRWLVCVWRVDGRY